MNRAALTRYADEMSKCSQCGLCEQVCPLMDTGLDPGPRARLRIARDEPEYLTPCLACGRCAAVCPAHIPLNSIFMAPLKRRNSFPAFLWRHQKLLDKAQKTAAICQKLIENIYGHTNLPKLAKNPWQPVNNKNASVLYFSGCLERRFLPEIGHACAEILHNLDYDFGTPELECCGRPLFEGGQGKNFTKWLKKVLKALDKNNIDVLLLSCPACLDTLKRLWPQADGLSSGERDMVWHIANKAQDIHIFLENKIKDPPDRQMPISWHKPCLMESEAETGLLRMLRPDEKLPAGCCAFSMSPVPFSQKHKVLNSRGSDVNEFLAQAALKKLRDEIMAASPSLLVTSCPACILRLRQALGSHIEIKHSLEILLDRLNDTALNKNQAAI